MADVEVLALEQLLLDHEVEGGGDTATTTDVVPLTVTESHRVLYERDTSTLLLTHTHNYTHHETLAQLRTV